VVYCVAVAVSPRIKASEGCMFDRLKMAVARLPRFQDKEKPLLFLAPSEEYVHEWFKEMLRQGELLTESPASPRTLRSRVENLAITGTVCTLMTVRALVETVGERVLTASVTTPVQAKFLYEGVRGIVASSLQRSKD